MPTYRPMTYDPPSTFASTKRLTEFLQQEKDSPLRDHLSVKEAVRDVEAEVEKRSKNPDMKRYWAND